MTEIEKIILLNQMTIMDTLETLLLDKTQDIYYESSQIQKRLNETNNLLIFYEELEEREEDRIIQDKKAFITLLVSTLVSGIILAVLLIALF